MEMLRNESQNFRPGIELQRIGKVETDNLKNG